MGRYRYKITFVIGVLLITTALIGYWGRLQSMQELTFQSNLATGLFFVIAPRIEQRKKKFAQMLYLDFTVLLLLVILICIVFAGECRFTGAMFFLHIVNPLIVIIYFFVFCELKEINNLKQVLTILIMPVIYLIFVLIHGSVTNDYIYFFLDYKSNGIPYSVIFLSIVAIAICSLGYGMFFLNQRIHQNSSSSR